MPPFRAGELPEYWPHSASTQPFEAVSAPTIAAIRNADGGLAATDPVGLRPGDVARWPDLGEGAAFPDQVPELAGNPDTTWLPEWASERRNPTGKLFNSPSETPNLRFADSIDASLDPFSASNAIPSGRDLGWDRFTPAPTSMDPWAVARRPVHPDMTDPATPGSMAPTGHPTEAHAPWDIQSSLPGPTAPRTTAPSAPAGPSSSAAGASNVLTQQLVQEGRGSPPHGVQLNGRALVRAVAAQFERMPGGPSTGAASFDTSQYFTPAGTSTGV